MYTTIRANRYENSTQYAIQKRPVGIHAPKHSKVFQCRTTRTPHPAKNVQCTKSQLTKPLN